MGPDLNGYIILDLLSSLSRYDDIELIRPVDRSREVSVLFVVRGSDVRDDTVEHDVCVLVHRAHVRRQTDEEGHSLGHGSRQTCGIQYNLIHRDCIEDTIDCKIL